MRILWNTAANLSSSDFAVTIEELERSKPNAKSSLPDHNFIYLKNDYLQEMLEWLAEAEEEDRRRAQDFSQVRYRPFESVLSRGSPIDVVYLG
jgi:hypothetical protein